MKGICKTVGLAALALVIAGAAACGGGSNGSPTSPDPGTGGGSGGSTNTTTITINANGVVTPNDITVPVGSRVTFINQHNRSHEMTSNPHPDHTDCPAINDVGFIQAGQTKQTGNLTVARTCGFHDHNDPGNTNLQGRIRIQ